MAVERPVQVPLVRVPGDEAGRRQAREGVGHRRPLGADETAEQPVGEGQRDADATRLDPAPAPGEVPQEQRQAYLEAGLARDRALHAEIAGAPPARRTSTFEICGHGRTRSAKARSSNASRDGQERPPIAAALQQVVERRDRQSWSRSPGPRSSVATPVATQRVDRDEPVDHEHAEPAPRREPAGRIVDAERELLGQAHGDHLTRDDAHAWVELLGEVVVEVEEVRGTTSRSGAGEGPRRATAMGIGDPVRRRWRNARLPGYVGRDGRLVSRV